jgi:hypothetical protein
MVIFKFNKLENKIKKVPTCTLKIQGLIRSRSLDIHPLVNFAIVVKKLMKNCYSVPFYIKNLTQIFAGIKTILPLCSFDTSCIICKNIQIVKIYFFQKNNFMNKNIKKYFEIFDFAMESSNLISSDE